MKIRAAVLEEFGRPLEVQEVDLAEPKAGEVLVRLVACGVCHTDLYTASGADPSGYAPTVLGHEGAGVVERVGEGVGSLAPGDHVVTLFQPQCNECVNCRSGKTNVCIGIREQRRVEVIVHGVATHDRRVTQWVPEPRVPRRLRPLQVDEHAEGREHHGRSDEPAPQERRSSSSTPATKRSSCSRVPSLT